MSYGVVVLFWFCVIKFNLIILVGFNKMKSVFNKFFKCGFMFLVIFGYDFFIDLIIFVDIVVNFGFLFILVLSFNFIVSFVWLLNLYIGFFCFINLILLWIFYNWRFLMGLWLCFVKLFLFILKLLKSFGILKFCGKRVGCRKIRILIFDRFILVSFVLLCLNVNRCNLIIILL